MFTYCNPEECVWIRFEISSFDSVCIDVIEMFEYKQSCMHLQLELNGTTRYLAQHVKHCKCSRVYDIHTEAVQARVEVPEA